MKRYRILYLAPELLIELCKPGPPRFAQVTENPLPDDTRFVRAAFQDPHDLSSTWPPNTVAAIVESAEFAEVPEGTLIPEHPRVGFRVVKG